MASMAPPPPFYGVMGGAENFAGNSNSRTLHSSSSDENVKPSIIAIVLILCITVLLSIFLYFLLRHLNRLCFRSSTSNITPAAASSHRVTPEQSVEAPFLDSLPLFTFSAITRCSNNGSTASADCAVCLSKFEPQDQLRLLPLCCHAFHADCIDAWLTSNQTCPLCRCPLFASESDILKVMLQSSNAACSNRSGSSDSFRLEIGSISHRQSGSYSGDPRRMSYSIESFDYIVEEESQLNRSQTNQRNMSDKEDNVGVEASSEASLAAEVATGRSWLKDYVDRLSFSLSSRAMSFRSSGRLVTGSSRRSDVSGAGGEYDVEANRIGEEISEMFRWFSGV
ncbi:E3 ubiquitin-protein ligase ATL4 [Hibiscus syriacus]|uniref:RING-type E3 ubiquitin transferase n=1 Tax=Hibiscus syriacus TaxID=106335 RepID=A0A6A2XVU3_HIBSY|nr:E3 ubiquitin-protein ligase ATL4-like [Hibiscus syriacus]KAE8679843.1 E3 ubiquitin-protein ligase ATL4 [Hibiscus syriacus]